jgi:hypothetical protein
MGIFKNKNYFLLIEETLHTLTLRYAYNEIKCQQASQNSLETAKSLTCTTLSSVIPPLNLPQPILVTLKSDLWAHYLLQQYYYTIIKM